MPLRRHVAAAAAAALLALAAPAPAQDLAPHLGPLAGVVELGDDGTWVAEVQGGWFTLSNRRDPGAVTYYWIGTPATEAGTYRAAMNLVVQGGDDGPAHAGFLFNFRAGDRYLGIVIGGQGETHVILRSPEGFDMQPVEAQTPPRGDGSDMLTATVDGATARFDLNGERLLEIEGDGTFSPRVGIIAVGTGLFGFTGFDIAPAG